MKKFYTMRNYISIALLLLASSVFAYDPPTMGWSSWNTYRVNISDKLIMKQADAMSRNGLKEVGYKYINIDDGYFGGRDASGGVNHSSGPFSEWLEADGRSYPCVRV